MRGQLIEVERTRLLGLILFEVSFIDRIFNLNLSLLFDLIVVDYESFSVIGCVIQS